MSDIAMYNFASELGLVAEADIPEIYNEFRKSLDAEIFRKLSLSRRFNSAIDRKAAATARLESATAQKNAFQGIVASLPVDSPLLPTMQYELERATWAETQASRAIRNVSGVALVEMQAEWAAATTAENEFLNKVNEVEIEWGVTRALNMNDLTDSPMFIIP